MAPEHRTIMVIEDDDGVRDLITEVLREEGYEVLPCAGAEEALADIESVQPALITLDLATPSMDGLQFLQQLRRGPAGALTPVVVITAALDSYRRNLPEGVRAIVGKPFHLDQLLKAVEQALRPPEPSR